MIPLSKDLREFIEFLNSREVRYRIAGGYAVAFHGHPRMTGDIDIFIEVSEENARRRAGRVRLLQPRTLREGLSRAKTIVQLGYPPNRIDVLTSLSGLAFEDAWRRRVDGILDGLGLPFISRDDLIANKSATGRPKDLADLDALVNARTDNPRSGRPFL